MKEKIIFSIVALILLCPVFSEASWSSWKKFSESSDVILYWKYNHHGGCTDVRWKAKNISSSNVDVSVGDKKYFCQTGGYDSGPDENIAVSLKPGKTGSTIADYCMCEGRGGVIRGEVGLYVELASW